VLSAAMTETDAHIVVLQLACPTNLFFLSRLYPFGEFPEHTENRLDTCLRKPATA
jgi:hypothetical protein